ncbi:SDR family oxidoreductase [Rubrivivax benzoatilyticus]|uniref:SDR family oxidoreductase n=1 Tax=Rubrivivax benzoatilyticus TaxID=316997 RepID=A0ABX0HZA6_9BURK|nr:SDR family oxidoreductase [Rubrivivax benzoatilyticus]EGJ11391.1 MaoC domain protein dehydratase [Rubrivivax benzoatilyticus JA2 = ATCC BAA-35]NHK99903.1 SDR family oxidoreductase [Rubrivivax benzoatilyticus]NHL25818.1 SDR family oxidoreductase [Rubrivivax benzoatilyticus]
MSAFLDFDTLKVGDCRQLVKTITEQDIRRFVELTGDDNPLHVDRAFARETAFKDIVVHGMLGASFISTVIGTKLPGPGALWVSQAMEFLLPVRLGDELTVTCTVLKKHERERLLELETRIVNQHGQAVLQGQGKVKMLLQRPAAAAARPRGEPSRVALVTGGAGGIGEAICRRLAQDGHAVVINYQGSRERANAIAADIVAAGGRALAVQADVSDAAGVEHLLAQARRHYGTVGVLVNNASPRIQAKALADTDWTDLQHHLDVQVKGAFLLSKLCAADMAADGAGRIVNITSQVTEGTPALHWTAYAVAKAALAMLSRNLAAELGPRGVTVNCVAPGMTETGLIGDIAEKQQLMIARQTPLRRLAVPEDVAAAVAYLVSDDARHVTGHTLDVNGGMVMS